MPDFNKRNLVNEKGASKIVKAAPSTLMTWRCTKRYDLPYYKVGGRVYYDTADLEAFLDSRRVGGK